MTGLAAKGLPLMLARAIIEITVLVAGGLLGGQIGIGTALFAFTIGPLVAWCLPKLRVRPTTATRARSQPGDPIRPRDR